jgi:hypothetical protein
MNKLFKIEPSEGKSLVQGQTIYSNITCEVYRDSERSR